jgi:hypothetical protein
MLSPQDLIGQKVWLSLQPDAESELVYGELETNQVQAEITQPTSPPWFFARYLNPPTLVRTSGQWLSLYEAEQAVLLNPVIEYDDDDYEDNLDDDFLEDDLESYENQLNSRRSSLSY